MKSLNVDKTTEALKDFYNHLANVYGETWQTDYMLRPKHQQERVLQTISILDKRITPTDSILELGCSNGALTQVFAKMAYNGQVDAVDISNIALSFAPVINNVVYIEDELINYLSGCKEKQYDVIIATEILEHIPNYAKAIRLMRRTGNYILISVPVNEEPNPDAFNISKIGKENKAGDATGHIHHFNRPSLEFHFDEIIDYWTNDIHLILGAR